MAKKTFKVNDMNCASCAVTIEKNLCKVKGVKKASVNYATKTTQVDFDESKTNEEELFDSVTKSGYTMTDESLRDIEFKVIGMSSEHCAGVVKNALKRLKGVKNVETNFANSFAKVQYEQGSVKTSDMKKAIDSAGYKAVIAEEGEDIYEKEERENMEDDAEISSNEAGFVEGYEADEEASMKKKKKKK